MIKLFNIPDYKIDSSSFDHLLHGEIVDTIETKFAKYVGAKYACMANSASSLLFLALKQYNNTTVSIPSTMPIVVPNAIVNAGHLIEFYDDVGWVGNCYRLYDKIFDSAQEVTKNQYRILSDNEAEIIYSFYPTKPIGGCDGGMIVSNNKDKMDYYRTMIINGTIINKDSWQREHVAVGFKMHCNSFQAYFALKGLEKLDEKNEILDKIRSIYNNKLGYKNTSRHLYRIHTKNNKDFINTMKEKGIQCGIHYQHCHDNKPYENYQSNDESSLALSELESNRTVSIPYHEKLKKTDVEKVIKNVKSIEK